MTDASLAAILEIYAITSGLQVRRAMERSDNASEYMLILLCFVLILFRFLLILLSFLLLCAHRCTLSADNLPSSPRLSIDAIWR